MCTYACIRIYVYMCISVYVCILYICIYLYIGILVCLYADVCICLYIDICISIYLYIHTYVTGCVMCIYACIHIYVYMCISVYLYILYMRVSNVTPKIIQYSTVQCWCIGVYYKQEGPQGSVLGPLLFIVYTNEFPEIIRNNYCPQETHKNRTSLFSPDCRQCGNLPYTPMTPLSCSLAMTGQETKQQFLKT